MDIRELKRAPIFADPDTFDTLLAYSEQSVAECAIVERPRNVAVLATLRATEMMVAMSYRRHELEFLEIAVTGLAPHAMPVFQAEVESKLTCLRQVLRAVYIADRPVNLRVAVEKADLRAAGVALLRGAFAASAINFLNEAALGWRGFIVKNDRIEMMQTSFPSAATTVSSG